jgi:ribose transport system permease protein
MKKINMGEWLKKYNLLVLLLVFIVIASILSPSFLKVKNFLNLLQQASIPGVVAIGMTLVIIIGGIDLSVGSVAAFSGMICAILLSHNMNFVAAIIISLVLGVGLGALNGLLIAKFKLPDFITTLAMMQAARGAALLTTKGVPVFGLSGGFRKLGGGFISGVPISGIIWIVLTILVSIMLKYTSFGRSLYAIGGNKEAAMLSGIKTRMNYIITYAISACLAAFAGILTASWLATGQPTAGDGMELNAIAAAVIGGASLSGGVGTVIGTFGGVFLLQILTNIFNLVGLASFYQQIAKGAIIVAALLLNKMLVEKKNKAV